MKEFLVDFFTFFVKITGWPVYMLLIRARIYLEEGAQKRPHGPVIIVSNHTSVYDFALYLYVFFGRTVRFLMAEVLFRKKLQGFFLSCLGGIRTDRNSHSLGGFSAALDTLEGGGAVGIFPEGRIPLPAEERPLKFAEGAARLALESGARIVPVVTDGRYFGRAPASVIIGKTITARELVDEKKSLDECAAELTQKLREKIKYLEAELEKRKKQNNLPPHQ